MTPKITKSMESPPLEAYLAVKKLTVEDASL